MLVLELFWTKETMGEINMKLKIVGPTMALFLLVGGVGVSAASNSNNGVPEQIANLQTAVSNLVSEVTSLQSLKNDVKSVKDELASANTTIAQQQTEIDTLKKEITNLKSSSPSSTGTITQEVKDALLKGVANHIGNFTTVYVDPTPVIIKVTSYDIKEIDGKVVLQIFTEGNYDWNQAANPGQSDGAGFNFAQNFIFNCDPIFKTYGVNMNYEFYQNGEKVITPRLTQN
jgi:hypothetical protein